MAHSPRIRRLTPSDLPSLRMVLQRTGLFPPEMLAPMAEPYLSGSAPHPWLVAVVEELVVGFAFAEPERMTAGTFNLLAMAVEPARQGRGVGQALVRELETQLRQQHGRVLLVETSALESYARTRAFYLGLGFVEEARIRDYYDEGEGKVVFWKHL